MDKQWSPEIVEIGERIVGLSLRGARELGDYLREVHGIEPAGSSVQILDLPLPEKPPEKTEFTVQIDAFDQAKKIALIKVVREITGLGLKEAKDLVENPPKPVKMSLPKAEAEALKKTLEENGATVSLV